MERHAQKAKVGQLGLRLLPIMCMLLASVGAAVSSGCTRHFFRTHTDKDVTEVLADKDRYPEWAIEQFHVYPDPRARFADSSDPDHPPMPPDDEAAWRLSPHPQKPCKAGVAYIEGTGYLNLLAAWDAENRAEAAAAASKKEAAEKSETPEKIGVPSEQKPQPEPGAKPPPVPKEADAKEKPPEQKGYAATQPAAAITTSLSTPPGAPQPYLLKLEQAVELGLINSREYQDARESLYMAALAVTLERFSFAAQFFAAGQAIREWAGRQTTGGHRNDWTLSGNAGFAKLFSTGALLLVNFANQTVINLSGPMRGDALSQSTINLDLVQPLLRGGGRAVTLEPLTQAERNLLYQIRTFARLRKEFYVAIAGGGAGGGGGLSGGGGSITGGAFQPVGVLASGTFSPNAGLGSAGLLPGVAPRVDVTGNPGLQVTPGPSGQITLNTALAAPIGGYLSTLLQAAQRQLDLYSIEKLEANLQLAKATAEGGDISELQVQQFEQQVLTRRTNLLTDQLQYLQSLDSFKLQLGLPTTLPIELDDTPFRPLNQQFQRYEDLFNQFVAASEEPNRSSTLESTSVRKELRRIFTTSALVRGTRFRTQIETRWSAWEKLSADELRKRQASYGEERRRLLDKKTDLEKKGQPLSAVDQQRLHELSFEIDLSKFEEQLRIYESQPWKDLTGPARVRRQQLEFRYVVSKFVDVLIEARNERLEQLRDTWPELARLCVNGVDLLKADLDEAQTAVVQAALINRLDLMNVRAQLADAWRQVAVFANALLGAFNVQYHMDSSTPALVSQPLNFSASRTRHELILNGELPLVRLRERNNYRASLINYQRARRILMGAEDRLASDTRNEIRLLRQLEENYRIQQRQVELGYLSVENSLDTFKAPAPPGVAATAANAAALTTQLINAQNSLYMAQFNMTTFWINYLNTRLQLYRDMELMPLDYRGVWTDEIATRECPGGAVGGSPESGSPCARAPRDQRPERPEPKSDTPAQGAAVEQAH